MTGHSVNASALHGPTVSGLKSFAFDPFTLIPQRRLLLKDGASVRIGRRAFEILLALVERQGEVVSKRELLWHAWPDTLVDQGNLKVTIAALRSILGRSSGQSRFIATVSGRGYRFVSSVQCSAVYQTALHPATLSKRNNNLPASSQRIFGRAETIDSILDELKSCQLLSIVGPGGVGKTTVALAVARKAAGFFDAGTWLVDLASLKDQSRVPDAIAMAIGWNAHAAKTSALISEYLNDRKMLLVLDNCEHLLDEVACWVDRILSSAKNVKLLVTTREPLCVRGERVRRLRGLSVPSTSQRITASQALDFSAVQLFADRAADACRSFELDDANAPTVAKICHKLDGLALAIERVAMRVGAIGVTKMLDYLDDRLLMFDGYHVGPERHRTLTTTIESSYRLLSENERVTMRRLSTFAGAFSLEAACSIGSLDDSDHASVVDGVANLVAKSLLIAETNQGKMEYRQNNITRAFALERLVEHGEHQSARRRHARHFLDFAEQAATECDQLSKAEWLARYGAKVGDVRDALNWALNDSTSASLVVRLTVAAIPFQNQCSMTGERRIVIEQALDDPFSARRSGCDDPTPYLAIGATMLHGTAPRLRSSRSGR